MKKDLTFVSNYFKALVVPQMPDDFTVAEKFRHGLTDDELRKGMSAFRDFLYEMYNRIAARKDEIDVKSGSKYDPYGTPGDRGTASIKECFPVFNDLTIILISLGFHGRLAIEPKKKLVIHGEDMQIIICPITEKYTSLIRMRGERKLEMFNLLSEAGLHFNGADFSEEVDFTKNKIFDITHSENEHFAVGLKLIVEAMLNHKDYYKIENLINSILLRGDFYSLANEKPKKVMLNIGEYANAQSQEIKEWIIKTNELILKNGGKLIQEMGGGPSYTYIKRGKTVSYGLICKIELFITGAFICPGVNHLENPGSIINLLPDNMAAMIKSGDDNTRFNPEQCIRGWDFARFAFTHKGVEYEGCRHAGHRCQFSGKKCRFTGFSFDLSEPNVRNLITKWIEMELTV
jgi:hypothetical protein